MEPLYKAINASHYRELKLKLESSQDDAELFKRIVNAPFSGKRNLLPLGLGIVVLLIVDQQSGNIDRVALSETEQAEGAVAFSSKDFHEIKIPLDHNENIISKAIRTNQPQQTDDWQYLFVPDLSAEDARFNQAGAGIGCSVVYPVRARDGAALIFSYFLPLNKIGSRHRAFMDKYSKQVAAALSTKGS